MAVRTAQLLLLLLSLTAMWGVIVCESVYALVNMEGVEGTFHFSQDHPGANVSVEVKLYSFKGEGANLTWAIHANAVSYQDKDRCNRRTLGDKLHDLTAKHGKLRAGSIAEAEIISFTDDTLTLFGAKSIWEKSLVLEGGSSVCGNLLSTDPIRVSQAIFTGPVAGSVVFRQKSDSSLKLPLTQISVDLFHVGSSAPTSSNHDWKILVTDILDTKSDDRKVGTCQHLIGLYDPDNADSSNCSSDRHSNCKKGDLTAKHGQVPVGVKRSRYSKLLTMDQNLPLPELDGPRYLYVAIYDKSKSNSILSCAKITLLEPKETKVQLSNEGVRGYIHFRQQSPLHPTRILVNLTNLQEKGVFYHVHKFPVRQKMTANESVCLSADDHFNPTDIVRSQSPSPGNGTYDMYEVGDLSGKYGLLSGGQFEAEYFDPYLTLYGQNSIVGRSIVIHKNDSSRWICGNVEYPHPVVTGVAIFRYPFVGRVIFRQDAKNPFGDTSVFVESLVYSDNTGNSSRNHQWYVHSNRVSKDSLDWQNRCFSAGPAFNSYKVNEAEDGYKDCRVDNPFRCATGDLTRKFGRLNVAAKLEAVNNTKFFFTDVNLPLSTSVGIIGRSLVIQDDLAPDFRGKRMACADIEVQYPSRARVNQWHASGSSSAVEGQLVFEQDTEYDVTRAEVKLKNLESVASGFHVHEVPVPVELAYPCTQDAVYAHFNPFGVDKRGSPGAAEGTEDQYEVGDLSGKYGLLDNADSYATSPVDLNLPVRGPFSVIGRSVVVHKKIKDERWVCGDVVSFTKENGKKIQAIASFYHPNGFAYGYIKMGQIEYADGSLSETTVEVSLRYPGANNKNITSGHSWGVHDGRVGEDQAVKHQQARCMAAGFRVNPYRVDMKAESYGRLCSPRSPLNCAVGDLGGRLGPLTIGGPRVVFSDANLPLTGNYSVMKQSIVVYDKNGAPASFSCGNIGPDNDIVQKIQVKKVGKGSGQAFIEKVREAMSVPEWMMHLDSGQTVDYDTCMQFTIFFRGPDAGQLQQDLDSLLNSGLVSKRYASAPGQLPPKKVKFHYSLCSTALDKFNSRAGPNHSPGPSLLFLFTLLPFLTLVISL